MTKNGKHSSAEKKKNLNRYDKYLKFVKKLRNYESKLLYFVILAFGFMFYTLAYVFFYGYYFGGGTKTVPSVLQIIINPVPFNFKALTMLGIVLGMIILVFASIANNIAENLKNKSKFVFIDIVILIIIILSANMGFTIMFIGNADSWKMYLYIWLFLGGLVIFYSLNEAGKQFDIFIGLIGAVSILFIILLVVILLKLNVPQNWLLGVFFSIWMISSILLTYLNFKKLIIYQSVFLLIYSIWGFRIQLNVFSFKSIIITVIILFGIGLIDSIYGTVKNHFYKKLNKKNKKNIIREKISKHDSNFWSKFKKYKLTFLIVMILGIVCSIYYSVFTLGKAISDNILEVSYDEITFYIEEQNNEVPSTMIGNIISYKDNVFYISDKNKQLITIKADKVKTKPYKE